MLLMVIPPRIIIFPDKTDVTLLRLNPDNAIIHKKINIYKGNTLIYVVIKSNFTKLSTLIVDNSTEASPDYMEKTPVPRHLPNAA